MNIKYSQPSKPVFMTEEEIHEALTLMEKDTSLDTKAIYIKDTAKSIRLVSFLEKHAVYLKEHPKVNPEHYLANLRTVLRIRP